MAIKMISLAFFSTFLAICGAQGGAQARNCTGGLPGIENQNLGICCPTGCGQCGESGCEYNGLPNYNSLDCCSVHVISSKVYCDTPGAIAPCIIGSAPTPAPAGQTCTGGLPGIENKNKGICCPIGCGQCGGAGCGQNGLPDYNSLDCCPGHVLASEVYCDMPRAVAPCIMGSVPKVPSSTEMPTLSSTGMPTPSPTEMRTPSPREMPTPAPTKMPTPAPTELPTPSPTEMPTPSPTDMPTPSPTEMHTPSPTEMPTPSPTEIPTPSPTELPTPSPTEMPTPSPTDMPTPSPTEMHTPSPTEMPTPSPTEIPTPSPTEMPTPSPTETPTPSPTEMPTPSPTERPTPSPTETPTPSPTEVPTPSPTEMPTPSPTDMPTPSPTEMPTPSPTDMPTPSPTEMPTPSPTEMPTPSPTDMPTPSPTKMPTPSPTDMPTPSPTDMPTPSPTEMPTPSPTEMPTPSPIRTTPVNTCLDLSDTNSKCGSAMSTGSTTLDFTYCAISDSDLADLSTCISRVNEISGGIRVLNLRHNELLTLPPGIFDGLGGSLRRLQLGDSALATLPDGIFDSLSSMQYLHFYNLGLRTLPDGIFDKLSSLRALYLETDLETLPPGIFKGLRIMSWLQLNDNALTTLPQGIFDGLPWLNYLGLHRNALTTLPDGIFDSLSSLKYLHLYGNPDLECLPTVPSTVTDLRIDNSVGTDCGCDLFEGVNGLPDPCVQEDLTCTPGSEGYTCEMPTPSPTEVPTPSPTEMPTPSGGPYSLEISCCDFGGASGSGDTIEFFTCSGGPYCVMSETPMATGQFNSGQTKTLTIDSEVEPTTLVISKPSGGDGWCLNGIKWEGGANLLAPSTALFMDPAGGYGNCNEGLLNYVDMTNAYYQENMFYPCMKEWRIFNLQGNPDFEYEFKVEGCDGVDTPPVTASFCRDTTCSSSDMAQVSLTTFNAGTTTFNVQLDFNPASMLLSATQNAGWCANAMSFNRFDFAASYPYTLAPAESRIVENLQFTEMPTLDRDATPSTSMTTPDYEEVGCYKDAPERIMVNQMMSDSMTVEMCQAHCVGSVYFGLQFGQGCWCDTATGDGDYPFDVHGVSTSCNMPCSGNQEQSCGGMWAMEVYMNIY